MIILNIDEVNVSGIEMEVIVILEFILGLMIGVNYGWFVGES